MPNGYPTRLRILRILAGCVALCGVIAWIDYVTGEDLDFFILYFIPVAVAAWYGRLELAVSVSFLAAGLWLLIDWQTSSHFVWTIRTWDTTVRLITFLSLAVTLSQIRVAFAKQQQLYHELTDAMTQIKQLRGILPMCSFCKKIREGNDHWVALEKYISDHSDARLSHGLCPHCYSKYYGSSDGT